jgi:hypothetical protein
LFVLGEKYARQQFTQFVEPVVSLYVSKVPDQT